MAYTETTRSSYAQRTGRSIKNILVGLGLFLASTCTLFWNEGNYVKTKEALEEGAKEVVSLTDISSVNPEFEGKFVHASGFANPKDSIYDDELGVRELAVSLTRKVEYYQWQEYSETETIENSDGSEEVITTYYYKKEWTNRLTDSSEFEDVDYQNVNFTLLEFSEERTLNQHVGFGAYNLPQFIVSLIHESTPAKINLSKEQYENFQNRAEKAKMTAKRKVKSFEAVSSTEEKGGLVHIDDNILYIGHSPDNPQVGDVRVTVEKVNPMTISLLAKVKGDSFEIYRASNGVEVVQVNVGKVSAEDMFKEAHQNNEAATWALRAFGIAMAIAALKLMFGFVSTLFKFIPMLGNIVEKGTAFIATVIGLVWSLFVIAIAWLFYRPIIGISLLIAIVGLILLLKRRKSQQEIEQTP